MGSYPVRLIRFQDDWVLCQLNSRHLLSFSLQGFSKTMCLRTWPPQNNRMVDVLMALTNANRVWYIIHEISGWWKYDVLGENPNQTSRPERGREQVRCSFHEDSPIFSSSSSSSLASLRVPSVTDVILSWHLSALSSCLTVLSPSPWGGTVCLWRFVYGGRNTPLLQAASSLSAHHTEHDSPPSLWCWDERFLLSPWGVRIFCFILSFLNFTSR